MQTFYFLCYFFSLSLFPGSFLVLFCLLLLLLLLIFVKYLRCLVFVYFSFTLFTRLLLWMCMYRRACTFGWSLCLRRVDSFHMWPNASKGIKSCIHWLYQTVADATKWSFFFVCLKKYFVYATEPTLWSKLITLYSKWRWKATFIKFCNYACSDKKIGLFFCNSIKSSLCVQTATSTIIIKPAPIMFCLSFSYSILQSLQNTTFQSGRFFFDAKPIHPQKSKTSKNNLNAPNLRCKIIVYISQNILLDLNGMWKILLFNLCVDGLWIGFHIIWRGKSF